MIPAVLGCLGLWLSVLGGTLGDDALHILSGAAPEYLWRTLRDMYLAFADLASSPTVGPEETAFVEELLNVHRWPEAAAALRRALAKNPFAVRRIVNGAKWAPRPDGLEHPIAGFWF